MIKLTDTQCVLLATAAKRDTLSIYPLPASLKPGGGLTKLLATLALQGLTEERETDDKSAISREDGDIRYGMFATAAGLASIGIETEASDGATCRSKALPKQPKAERVATKTSAVLALLGRDEGATLAELIAATDWLPHTTRAALTGLRKKNHAIERSKRHDVTCYFLRAA